MKLRIIYENDENSPEEIARQRRTAISVYAASYTELLMRKGEIDSGVDAQNMAYNRATEEAKSGEKSHLTNEQLFDIAIKMDEMGRPEPTEEIIGQYILRGDHTGNYVITKQNKKVGYIRVSDGGGTETITARENFRNVVGPRETAGRLHSIEVRRNERGAGLGKWLVLRAMANMKSEWLFNSQLSDDAVGLFTSLKRLGWIDLHWKGQVGEVFVARLTPAGRQALESRAFAKA